jgi:prophage maintenance system killer protein
MRQNKEIERVFDSIKNKSALAFAATFTFLTINQKQITASADEVGEFILSSLEKGDFEFERIVDWLRQHVV